MSKDSDNATAVAPTAEADKSGYSAEQRTALITRMFTCIREDVAAINRSIVAKETPDGYLISHDDAAIASTKLMRAGAAVAALEKIFASALPADADITTLENEAKELSAASSPAAILDSFGAATKKLSSRNKSDPDT